MATSTTKRLSVFFLLSLAFATTGTSSLQPSPGRANVSAGPDFSAGLPDHSGSRGRSPFQADRVDISPGIGGHYGIAILASDVGHAYHVTNLVEFVEQGRFSTVILDWAWITYHWDRTDFQSVRELVGRLQAKGVEVPAMYRPRFLSEPTVPEQLTADGRPAAAHGRYPCFSSAAARTWSARWGERILEQCPGFNQIIIYNPLDACQCDACRHTRTGDPYGSIWSFLAEAKSAWRRQSPGVQLGVVFNPDKNFWLRGKGIADVAWPFFRVLDEAELSDDAARILEVQRTLGSKSARALAKVTWGPADSISIKTLADFNHTCRQQGISPVLWTFDALFLSSKYDPAKTTQALGLDFGRIEAALRPLATTAPQDQVKAPPPETPGDDTKPGSRTRSLSSSAGEGRGEEAPSFARSNPARSPWPSGGAPPLLSLPPPEPSIEKLPWPHQAPNLTPHQIEQLNREVWVINNYPLYQADDAGAWCYFHGGLDIVLTNGAKIYAMKDGWVKAIAHSSITIADAAADQPCYGWSYSHLGNFRVREGAFVKRGALLGEVSFRGLPHTHLEKVFSQGPYWRTWAYACFPDDHFTFHDREPPTLQTPFHFFEHNSNRRIAPRVDGTVVLRGDIDIVVAMRDGGEFAHSKDGGFGDRLGVTRIEYTIHPAGRESEARRFRSFDFRKLLIKRGTGLAARAYTTTLARIVYKHYALFAIPPNGHQTFSYCLISHCPGDQPPSELDGSFTDHCWQTTARSPAGTPLYPDGDYIITVTAFDSRDNRTTRAMQVTVANWNR